MAVAERTRDAVPADEVERIIAARVDAEVSARIGNEIQRQMDELKTTLATAAQGGGGTTGDNNWMEALAFAISKVADQNSGKPIVAPDEIAKRTRAHATLERLLEDTLRGGVQPIYTLRQVVYLGDRKIQPLWVDRNRVAHPTEIGWWGIPNQYMEPMNDEARAIMALYLESIGDMRKTARNLRITPGGLTVRSGGMDPEGGRDAAPRVGRDVYAPTLVGRGSEVKTVELRILGSLMPPAQQIV